MKTFIQLFIILIPYRGISQLQYNSKDSYIGISIGANASKISNLNFMVNDRKIFTASSLYSDKSEWTYPEINASISYIYANSEKLGFETRAGYSAHGGKMTYSEVNTYESKPTLDNTPLNYQMWYKYNYVTLGQYINYNFKDKENGFYASTGINVDLIRNDDNIVYKSNAHDHEVVDRFEQDNLRTIFEGQAQLHLDVLFGYYFKLKDRLSMNVNISGTCPFLSPYDVVETQANDFLKIENRNLYTILRFNVGITFPSASK